MPDPGREAIPEIRQLTGLRGVAALSVVLGHFPTPFPLLHRTVWHTEAVDLFFCLSALTLGIVYGVESWHRISMRRFLAARIARVYPLYAITLLVAAAGLDASQDGLALRDFVLQALAVNSWPPLGTGVFWNLPAWSISVEAFCYVALFPLLLRLQPRLVAWPARRRAGMALLLMLVSASGYWLRDFAPAGWRAGLGPASTWILSYWEFFRGSLDFMAGGLMAVSLARQDRLLALCQRFASLLAGTLLLAIFAIGYHAGPKLFVVVGFPFLILGLTRDGTLAARVLGWRPLHYLGLISYSLYLWHSLLGDWLMPLLRGSGLPRGLVFVAALGAVLLIAAASYHAIERPLRRALRRALQAQRVPAG